MAKDINLTSQEWCDIVFESKNKAYGAYEMRQTSSRRHLMALLFIVGLAMLLAVLSALIKTVNGTEGGYVPTGNPDEENKVTEVNTTEKVKNFTELPPPPVKPAIQHIAPVMASSDELNETNRLKPEAELLLSQSEISFIDIIGENVEGAVSITEIIQIAEVKDPTYDFVEDPPQFLGGDSELLKYIKENLKYPTISIENGIQGTVTIRFVVNKDGYVSDVEILQNRADAACGKEAIRVVQSMPKWKAGKQNGVPVNVYFTLPIVYRLQN
jgi:TonB family C-terminal domain